MKSLNFLLIYFSLVDDGNTCMSLIKERLLDKWNQKINGLEVSLSSSRSFIPADFEAIREESNELINNYLGLINDDYLSKIIGEKKLFIIEDKWLYARKYYKARTIINDALGRIFRTFDQDKELRPYKELVVPKFSLTKRQEEAVIKGYMRNLIITGGPGTGKTTSIFFLLVGLLASNPDYTVYLAAPSGKASSRMKESILGGVKQLTEEARIEYQDIISKIENLKEYTIHRLLGYDAKTGGFVHNSTNQFNSDSIFVIDEASMADVSLFSSLVSAIPEGARFFILGDKNQLPSVDSGAVLSDLLKSEKLKDYVVELDESQRFTSDSKIYELAEAVNNNTTLPVTKDDFVDPSLFSIREVVKGKYPIYYYRDSSSKNEQEMLDEIIIKWAQEFYRDLPFNASDISLDIDYLRELYARSNKSRILCAENEGIRGIKRINNVIINNFIRKAKVDDMEFMPGEIVMITKNNKSLDLYNGETGLVVTFKDDATLYFMIEKSTNIVKDDGKKDNAIFKLGEFVFYPIRLIAKSEIDYAFAITIHKSQGSDYPSILVILPKSPNHPLVTREIIYTAITRTKGNTYIVSNLDVLEKGKSKRIERDTNIG